MKIFRTLSTRPIVAVGFSGTFWAGLALIILSLVVRAMGGTATGLGTWLLITVGSLGGAAVGGWYTQPLLKWFVGAIRLRKRK